MGPTQVLLRPTSHSLGHQIIVNGVTVALKVLYNFVGFDSLLSFLRRQSWMIFGSHPLREFAFKTSNISNAHNGSAPPVVSELEGSAPWILAKVEWKWVVCRCESSIFYQPPASLSRKFRPPQRSIWTWTSGGLAAPAPRYELETGNNQLLKTENRRNRNGQLERQKTCNIAGADPLHWIKRKSGMFVRMEPGSLAVTFNRDVYS